MAPVKKTAPATGAPGTKVLITTAAVAATLGGWALFAGETPEPVTETPVVAPAATSDATSAPELRQVTAPQVSRPAPVTTTRSSR